MASSPAINNSIIPVLTLLIHALTSLFEKPAKGLFPRLHIS